ncbi:MAG: hypothetical protein BroJett029_28320 [Alphaproteobacteria bacterium]|nr:MAG: hypothetical protein BroJett029_28320 [Alphaproteobacteria bacterium]
MRALITRPEEDAAPLAQALEDRGVEVTVEPLLAIRPVAGAAIDLDGVQTLIFTSSNGVRAFAALSERRDIDVLTVGDATAEAARAAGFARVESAGGDVGDLARLIRERADPAKGALFHAAGSVVAGDLAGQLAEAGYDFRRAVLYEAKPAEALSPGVVEALADRGFDLVLFFSPRTAATFVELVDKADDRRAASGCAAATALCLSEAVARAAEALPWKQVLSAEHPDLPSMLRLVDRALASSEPSSAAAAAPQASSPQRPEPLSPPPLAAIAPPRRGNAGAIAAAAAIAAVVAFAVAATEPVWRPYVAGVLPETPAASDPAMIGRVDALEQQSADLGQRLAALDGAVNQLDARDAGAVTDMRDLTDRLDALERQAASLQQAIEAVRQRPAPEAPAAMEIPDEIAALPGRLSELQRRVDAVADAAAAQPAPAPEVTEALDGLRAQVEALATTASGFEAWIATMESRIAAAESLEPRVAALEEAGASAERRATGNAALALAVNQLQAALAAARPFQAELAAIGELAQQDPELAAEIEAVQGALAGRAESGVPTVADLRIAFPPVARAVVAASRAEQAADAVAPGNEGEAAPGWLDQAMLKLSELVSVRPVGEDVAGEDAAARVARAEAMLGRSDLAGAVAELEGLDGRPAEAAAGWLADARARLAAEAALAALQAAVVARLAPTGAGG